MSIFLPRGQDFAKIFCPGAGNLTTLKRFPGGQPRGGCWCLELTDALGSDDVIIPGTANLSFNIELTSAVDANRTLVSNIGRAIVKKLAVKFEGNEIMSVDDFDVLACYRDLWKTKSEKRNAIRQGIISTDGCMENCIKLRINAGDKNASNAQDKAIADAYGNKFIIPLDFEMLDSAAPYYQAGLGNRLCYELTFNDYNRVTKCATSPKAPDPKYRHILRI